MERKNAKSPNILWFCSDQQRHDTIHAWGNKKIRTPNMDRLVREGVSFTNAFSQSPICTPSRTSFLTGRYPRTTGVTMNGGAYFPEDEVPVTRLLAESGYECGLTGKLHLSAGCGIQVEDRHNDGYRFFKFSHAPRNSWPQGHDYQDWLKSQGIIWEEAYKGENGGIESKYHQTTWCVNEAISFIEENRNKPWLISINPYDPHPPFDPPQEFSDRYDVEDMPEPAWVEGELDSKPYLQRLDYMHGGQDGHGPAMHGMEDKRKKRYVASYYAAIEHLDEQLGRILDYLDRTGERENTIVVFHSDHGEMLGDHGLMYKGCYFYDQLVHVPLVISWSGHYKEGLVSDALVELCDLAPTLLAAVGMEVPYYMQGKSLLPILSGSAGPGYHKDSVYAEFYDSLLIWHEGIYATMYRDKEYKLVTYHAGEEVNELYHLKNDPGEFVNLWDHKDYEKIKWELVKKSFDRTVLMTDPKIRKVEFS